MNGHNWFSAILTRSVDDLDRSPRLSSKTHFFMFQLTDDSNKLKKKTMDLQNIN
jgi:hypothetical protein